MSDLNAIENDIKNLKEQLKTSRALKALEKNKHFKTLITDGYLKEYALNIVGFKASIAAQEEKVAKHADFQLAGVAGLMQFFQNIRQAGITAEESLKASEEELDLLLNEEG